MSNKNTVLQKKDLLRAGRRWFIGVSTFNYETQLAPSVIFSLYPLLRKIYPNDDDLKKSVLNHSKYFNTHPWVANLILGAALGMEDEGKLESHEAVQDLKVGLMGPLAGIGDTIIWAMFPTIFGAIAASMAQNGSVVGTLIWIAFFGSSLFLRPQLMWIGYKQGTKIFTSLGEQLNSFTESISILGLTVVGAILSSSIKMQTGLVYKNGDVSFKLQETLDSLIPSLLPILVITVLYFLMGKKKMKMTYVIFLVIVFSMICSFLGILSA